MLKLLQETCKFFSHVQYFHRCYFVNSLSFSLSLTRRHTYIHTYIIHTNTLDLSEEKWYIQIKVHKYSGILIAVTFNNVSGIWVTCNKLWRYLENFVINQMACHKCHAEKIHQKFSLRQWFSYFFSPEHMWHYIDHIKILLGCISV